MQSVQTSSWGCGLTSAKLSAKRPAAHSSSIHWETGTLHGPVVIVWNAAGSSWSFASICSWVPGLRRYFDSSLSLPRGLQGNQTVKAQPCSQLIWRCARHEHAAILCLSLILSEKSPFSELLCVVSCLCQASSMAIR